MWLPESAEEVRRAAADGSIEEGPSFDAKRELPSKSRNVDVAIDVAAMANDGGVLLYGVGEDEHERPTVLIPLELAGQAERVDRIVRTAIAEPPYVEFRELQLDDDPARGFLVVVVPQSERAPHQVTAGGEMRFYGRAGRTNVRLGEAEIARLYARREQWQVDRGAAARRVHRAGAGAGARTRLPPRVCPACGGRRRLLRPGCAERHHRRAAQQAR